MCTPTFFKNDSRCLLWWGPETLGLVLKEAKALVAKNEMKDIDSWLHC
jgi:hypothetical protein